MIFVDNLTNELTLQHQGNQILIPLLPYLVRGVNSRRLRWAGHVARMEEGRSAFKILTDKPTGKRPL